MTVAAMACDAYINGDVVVCIRAMPGARLISDGLGSEVIDRRVAFETDTEDECIAAIERPTGRRVVAFISADEPAVRCLSA